MCGIIGSIGHINQNTKESFKRSFDSIAYRGPDDSGIWTSDNGLITFGHRRLSIIDLSDAGHQPKLDSSSKFTIVFNGEIYNYKELKQNLVDKGIIFSSNSDTEVLVEGYKVWGSDLVNKIEGMFAFAIFDENKNEIFIARDIAGEKPLFYFNDNKNFFFGSEHHSVRTLSSQTLLNDKSLSQYLMRGYTGPKNTLIQNINELEPASYLILNCDSLSQTIKKYWNPPTLSQEKKGLDHLTIELTELILESVEKTLISDVPVGVLLSGGLDSSLLTAFASKLNSSLKTFSVSFDDHLDFNESNYSNFIADTFKTDHLELNASQLSAEKFEFLASNFDTPIADTSIIPTFLLTEEVSKHCKVVLGGDGADELFGGYHRYSQITKISCLANILPMAIKNFLSLTATTLPTGTKGRQWINLLTDKFSESVRNPSIFFDKADQLRLMNISTSELELIYKDDYFPVDSNGLVYNLSKLDFCNYLPGDILLKVDRTSMLNSLEVRAPFLSKSLIEFSFKYLSSDLKIRNGEKKYLLKHVAKKILPKNFDFNRKQGFSFPFVSMLQHQEWKSLFKKYLLSNHSSFDQCYVQKLKSNKLNIKNNSERLFALLFFEIWKQNNLNKSSIYIKQP